VRNQRLAELGGGLPALIRILLQRSVHNIGQRPGNTGIQSPERRRLSLNVRFENTVIGTG
jgi:hypothetical protein